MNVSERSLAAILAADVVGYSRLMADDEGPVTWPISARGRRDVVGPVLMRTEGRLGSRHGDEFL